MGNKNSSGKEFYSDLVDTIQGKLEEHINDEYTALKIQYLDNLDYILEAKRNEAVKKVLDGIDILFKQGDLDLEPTIQIKVIKKIERGR